MSSKPEDLANIDLDKVVIQAAPKPRGIVGERIWGPYKIHAGTSVSDKYSGGPFGFGKYALLQIKSSTLLQKIDFSKIQAAGHGRCCGGGNLFDKIANYKCHFSVTCY